MPGQKEEELTAALEAWRDRTLLTWLGSEHEDLHGGALVLSDKVIKDIVKYASKGKIKSIETLKRESQWSKTSKYGAQVLEIIKTFYPFEPELSIRRDNTRPAPLGDSTAFFSNAGVGSVRFHFCREACCMISMRCN